MFTSKLVKVLLTCIIFTLLVIPAVADQGHQSLEFKQYIKPRYPALAIRKAVQGQVLIELELHPNGKVKNCDIIRAVPEGYFENAVKFAAQQWQFNVDTLSNRKSLKVQQEVAFSLCDNNEPCVKRSDF